MRICHVNLASGYSGGENQTLLLIEHQLSLGYQLSVVANPKSPFYQRCSELDLKLYPCEQFFRQHPKSISQEFPIIHTHEGKAIYWALIENLLFKTPYVITRRVDNLLKDKVLLKLAYERASSVVALSRAIKSSIQSTIPSLTPTIIPSSPVLYDVTDEQRESLGGFWKNTKHAVIQVGKLYPHKGFDVTIKAAKILEQTHPEVHFYLIGDGPEADQLMTMADQQPNISFVGKQTNIGAWFEAADLIIHPSYSEGLGSVLLEASAAGLPLIGSRAGGIPDIIQDNVNGLLFEPGNAAQLAHCVTRMFNETHLINKLKKNAEKVLDRFRIERSAAHYEAIYESIQTNP